MRPTGLELLRGVRSLLAQEVLPEMVAPHLRSQVMLAVGMLDAAAAELDDAPVAYAEERARTQRLAAEALPLIERLKPGGSIAAEVKALAAAPRESPHRPLSAEAEAAARRLGLLDRLAAFCDEHADDAAAAALSDQVEAELRALTARRLRWLGGGPPG